RLQARNENLPDARWEPQAHRMAAAIPVIETPHHRYPACIGCPHGEPHALYTVNFHRLRAEHAANLAVIAFAEQVHVHFAQLRAEAERVFGDLLSPGPAYFQQVGLRV